MKGVGSIVPPGAISMSLPIVNAFACGRVRGNGWCVGRGKRGASTKAVLIKPRDPREQREAVAQGTVSVVAMATPSGASALQWRRVNRRGGVLLAIRGRPSRGTISKQIKNSIPCTGMSWRIQAGSWCYVGSCLAE